MKSPFVVVRDFLSPYACEQVIDLCNFNVPNVDKNGAEIVTTKTSDSAQQLVYSQLMGVFPTIEQHFDVKYKGTEPIQFEWIPQNAIITPKAENSIYVGGKWARTKPCDFTAVLFLVNYQDEPPIDIDFEVFGGKLEFPQHQFSFNPERGTLIVFPSDARFINATSLVEVGDAYQARIQFVMTQPYHYNPRNFPGDYRSWFANL